MNTKHGSAVTLFMSQMNVLKGLLAGLNLAAFTVFSFLQFCVTDASFSWKEDLPVFAKVMAVGSFIAVCIYLLFLMLIAFERRLFVIGPKPSYLAVSILLLLTILFVSCKGGVQGIKKDFSTGLQASYQTMEPEDVQLVINGEVLGHSDIPLGEQFAIVNKGVKGLVQRDGKIAVGAALLITDASGKVLLKDDDLFKDKAYFEASEASYLRCMVSTGKPMNWDEKYKVKVSFWDKWGSGKINNEVTVRMIDVP